MDTIKTTFKGISQRLEDPFFEVLHLGKQALKTASVSRRSLEGIPGNFRLPEWTEEDSRSAITYAFRDSDIGLVLLAATEKGLCYLGFENNNPDFCLKDLKRRFPGQELTEGDSPYFGQALAFCNGGLANEVSLHLKGTSFQLAVWKKLLCIPEGKLIAYSSLADDKKAARAVGTAVGDNPVSYIVPCHRVIRSDGSFHGYFWGTDVKRLLLAYELQTR